jgi:peroxiredoxin
MPKLSTALLFICGSLLSFTATGTAIVTGIFKNALPNDRVEIFVPHYYADGRSDTYRAILGAQNEFALAVEVPEPQLVFLVHNEERLPLFLEPADSLHIRTDLFQFPLVASFLGRAAQNNRLLLEFFRQNAPDFNEFNNLQFKIGQTWVSVEPMVNVAMEEMTPIDFRAHLDKRRLAGFAQLDEFWVGNPGALTNAFKDWLTTDILYYWAYHLLVYGEVYKNRHGIQPDFFEFLGETPLSNEWISNDFYRQFLQAYLARHMATAGVSGGYFAAQYKKTTELLEGKAQAYVQSELIKNAFSAERYQEILPLYTQFLQQNRYRVFDQKVAPLYEKSVRISPGVVAPVFTGKDFDGDNLSLGQFRGKVVYVNFWATWCAACLQKMDFFDGFAADLKAKGVEIVNISVDEQADRWRSTLTERRYKGYHLLSSGGFEFNIAKAFGVEAVPQYFIVDKNGAFTAKPLISQPDDIRRHLLELLDGRQ